ncbi:MAG: 3' terminal RNA ribose 2'-O-methyltransferase Hen1 [Myxococcales bacterium]|nr:3' terminal RNA ribose 2'-O-methyltransferase Hen1 [Myxococcales bacterium]
MLLTVSTTHRPATDLGFLLEKNPARSQSFDLAYGMGHVFYPEVSEDRCTACLLLEIDPVGLVRGKGRGQDTAPHTQYVNDRPYVASSFLSVALAQVFSSALKGKSRQRPDLAKTPIPLEANLAALPASGGEEMIRRLFEPLGYEVEVTGQALDERFPDWGTSPYFDVQLRGKCTLSQLLSHLYVLIPVLDDAKHYFVSGDELKKLLDKGGDWLPEHPERALITRRYLKHRRDLTREALAQLEGAPETALEESDSSKRQAESKLEQPLGLNDLRIKAVVGALKEAGASSVIDLGCGDGKVLRALMEDHSFQKITGMDVSYGSLEYAKKRLRLDELPPRQRQRIDLIQGSLTYRDSRFSGHEAACLVEVIEHLDSERLAALEQVVFEFASPPRVLVTTPNIEYNTHFHSLKNRELRHADHRFEWTRAEFRAWAERVAEKFGYQVSLAPIGPDDGVTGPPTQMGVFKK